MDVVRSEFYERLPAGSGTWIREVWSDFLIVDGADGELYQIPWTEGTGGSVSFGAPVPVTVQYVPSAEETAEDAMLGRFTSQDPKLARAPRRVRGTQSRGELLAILGLPEGTPDADVSAAVRAKLAARARIAPAPRANTRVMPRAQYEGMVLAAADGRRDRARLDSVQRDQIVAKAVEAGRFPRASAPIWRQLLDVDPQGTEDDIMALAPGTIARQYRDVP